MAGVYTLTVKDANKFLTTKVYTVTQPLVINSINTQTNNTCFGSNNAAASVSVTGGTGSYTYTWSPSGGTTSIATGLSAGGYTVNVKDANNCSYTRTFNITQPLPVVVTATANNSSVCEGGTVTLTAGGASTYTISGGNAAVSPTATSSYSFTGTSSNGCVSANAAVATVMVNALPTLTFTAAKDTACINEANVTLSGLPSGGVYSGTNVTGNAFAPTRLGTFTLSYSYTNSATGCFNTRSFNVLVDPCAGVVELNSALGISVFPNPSNDIVNLTVSQGEIEAVTLYDMTRRIIFTRSVTSEKAVLDLSDLASGLYYVNVVSGSNSGLIKVVKN